MKDDKTTKGFEIMMKVKSNTYIYLYTTDKAHQEYLYRENKIKLHKENGQWTCNFISCIQNFISFLSLHCIHTCINFPNKSGSSNEVQTYNHHAEPSIKETKYPKFLSSTILTLPSYKSLNPHLRVRYTYPILVSINNCSAG